ncbi:MAG: hypothetical protein H0V05_09395, partial [Euzebyaceae bacterium]|nr:hypothetical protein [Euzebyaceae bacterium]
MPSGIPVEDQREREVPAEAAALQAVQREPGEHGEGERADDRVNADQEG